MRFQWNWNQLHFQHQNSMWCAMSWVLICIYLQMYIYIEYIRTSIFIYFKNIKPYVFMVISVLFTPALLRYNWCINLCKFRYIMWWFDTHMLTQVRLVSTFFTSCHYHFVIVLVMVRTLTLYSHSCFRVHKIVVSMLYIRLPELIHLTNEFVPFAPTTQPLETTILLSISFSSLFLDSTCAWDYTIFDFLSDSFH